ncbi:MAG: type II secretion system minor pseudopilin GspK [Piscinibacter sp.]|uniref:type II secretion system minor pseudopilin GspK n=1 Tax=Piscinibacter sp. TaxID=1903157 RepID=UPI001B57E1CE|nr:type II secretion system minor pseudopilin GspK [Piscinibacter sp.]MBP5989758.1 type II secretion system minor pseudopilin GspK [Piscinibacter sp.]MBP6027087.1 type II secretion system minor pseudopilin GspK [Piscinibacter sp.]
MRLPTPRRSSRRQRGAALLTALIIVTLVVTLAASMVWQQWRAVQVETAERARMQSSWILQGALDWARLILREDARSGRPTALTEPWATPLAEARLSTFLAADKNNNAEDDGPEAFLSGSISDAQARFNLANLVDASGKLSQPDLEALERLCQTVGLATDVATRIATGLRDAQAAGTGSNGNAPLRPRTLAQLAWLGLDAATITALEPYATLLPTRTPVNANTAAREVLAAVIKGLDLATAERLVQLRQRDPFKTLQAVETQIPGLGPLNGQQVSVVSSYFEVRGRLRLDDRVLEQRSLVFRSGLDMQVLHHEQVSTVEGLRS